MTASDQLGEVSRPSSAGSRTNYHVNVAIYTIKTTL